MHRNSQHVHQTTQFDDSSVSVSLSRPIWEAICRALIMTQLPPFPHHTDISILNCPERRDRAFLNRRLNKSGGGAPLRNKQDISEFHWNIPEMLVLDWAKDIHHTTNAGAILAIYRKY